MLLFLFSQSLFAGMALSLPEALQKQYEYAWRKPSPIHEHVPTLRALAKECPTVVEIGLWDMTSSWGLLTGLAENPAPHRSYLGIDIRRPPAHILNAAEAIAENAGIQFTFWHANDMNVDFDSADLLFIDSLHTYCHLTYELEKFSPHVRKYIAMHDTSPPWGMRDDNEYKGNRSEYPEWISRTRRGLWLAVVDFLRRHPEWELQKRYLNCHGFTILKRKES